MNSLLQGAKNELHTSKNCAMIKSPKMSSFETLITKQNIICKNKKQITFSY